MTRTRTSPRAQVSLVARYRSPTIFEFVEEQCYDLSQGGMFIRSLHPAPTGTLLKIECEVDQGPKAIRAVARVVWHRELDQPASPSGMGVKFVKLDADTASLIEEIVARTGVLGTDSEPPRRSSAPVSGDSGRPISQKPSSGNGEEVLSSPAKSESENPSEPQGTATFEKTTSVPPTQGDATASDQRVESPEHRAATPVPSPDMTPAPQAPQAPVSVQSGATMQSASVAGANRATAGAPSKEAPREVKETAKTAVAMQSATGGDGRERIGKTPATQASLDARSSQESLGQAAASRKKLQTTLAAIALLAVIGVVAALVIEGKETKSPEIANNVGPAEIAPTPPPRTTEPPTSATGPQSAPTQEVPSSSKPAQGAPLHGADRSEAAQTHALSATPTRSAKSSNVKPATVEPKRAIEKKRPLKKEPNKLSPLAEANACLIAGDNQCAIRALEGKARTPAELGLLIESYRAVGQQELAYRNMETYIKKYPAARRSAIYRTILELRTR